MMRPLLYVYYCSVLPFPALMEEQKCEITLQIGQLQCSALSQGLRIHFSSGPTSLIIWFLTIDLDLCSCLFPLFLLMLGLAAKPNEPSLKELKFVKKYCMNRRRRAQRVENLKMFQFNNVFRLQSVFCLLVWFVRAEIE